MLSSLEQGWIRVLADWHQHTHTEGESRGWLDIYISRTRWISRSGAWLLHPCRDLAAPNELFGKIIE